MLSQVLSAMAEGYLELLLEGLGCWEAGVVQALDRVDDSADHGGSERVGHDGSQTEICWIGRKLSFGMAIRKSDSEFVGFAGGMALTCAKNG